MKTKSITGLILTVLAIAHDQAPATDVKIDRSGSQVILSWPQAATNDFYLQFATNLSAQAEWTNAADPATNGADLVVTDNITGSSRFYRLQAWEVLFDGTNTTAFRSSQSTSFPSNSWFVTNGTLASRVVGGATHLMTTSTYTNFELRLSWKCDTNGNSGLFYRQTLGGGAVSPEYQLFDDANVTNSNYRYQFANYTNQNNLMGAVFGYIAPTNKTIVPTGQWNDCRVIVQGYHVTHWLNGNIIVDYQIDSPAFTNVFTQATGAYIAFQNKGNGDDGVVPGRVYFRDIKIRKLP